MVRVVKVFRQVCSLFLAVTAVGMATCAVQSAQPALTPDQQIELKTLTAQLSDPARTSKTKREAALLLLRRPYPQARTALRDFLADASNRPGRIAVAAAISESGRSNKEFVKPLLAMLKADDTSVRAPAAEALAASRDYGGLDELIRLLSARRTDRDIRLVIISAIQRVLDKKAVDALVSLLNEPDETIRNAACDALANLTSIRAFGRNPRRWKSWWARNRNKRRSEWLADLAETLAKANLDLERKNAELRRRLADAMNDLYTATPPTGRDALLVEMLSDPLAEVRLAAVRLTRQRLTVERALGEPLLVQVRARVTDADPAVRSVAVILIASITGDQAVQILAGRLKVEQSSQVREAIYQGLGLLRDASVWEQLLTGISDTDRRVAAAAAGALARIAEKNNLSDERRAAAADVLTKRYRAGAANNSAGLREAILGAMGVLKDKRLAGLFTSALKDHSAAVRLSGIKALQQLRLPESASSVAPLVRDEDRGVRLAAIAAVGALGQAEHVETILSRTDAKVEPDAAVRRQAWSVVMGLLTKAETAKMEALAGTLAKRTDATGYLIDVLKLWVGRIPAQQVDKWIPVRLRLGRALMSADRPAEAAGELSAVHAAMVKAGKTDDARKIWVEWIKTLLSAGDATVIGKIADVGAKEFKQFNAAIAALQERLAALSAEKDWNAVVRLAGAALQRLPRRLNKQQAKTLSEILRKAEGRQRLIDSQRVSTLVARLSGTDAGAREAAARELAAMKERAVGPLVRQLREKNSSEKPDPAVEKAILKILSTLAPQLKGYDTKAAPAERVKTLDEWLKKVG